jgi:hypothetical protein
MNNDLITDETRTLVQPGRIFKYGFPPSQQVIHIRAIIDTNQVVYKWWSKVKKRWRYDVTDLYALQLFASSGGLELIHDKERSSAG